MFLTSTTWTRLTNPPVSVNPSLLLQGTDIYAFDVPNWAGAGESHLARSRNAGTSWTAIDDPCPGLHTGYRTASASAAPNGVLAVLCESVTLDRAVVQISTDRGKTFGPRRGVPGNSFGPIAAASADTIAVGYSAGEKSGVIVTRDGGLTWRSTLVTTRAPSPGANLRPLVGWQDAQTGRASFNTNSIWSTRDGGRTWTEDRVTG
jgi:hypothetical protein